MSKKSEITNSFIKIFFTNLLVLISGVLVGLMLPKIMNISDYGYYKTFALYNTYKSIFSFGLSEGAYLWISGKKGNIESQNKCSYAFKIFLLIESVCAILLFSFIFLFNGFNVSMKVIMLLVVAYSFLSNVGGFCSNIAQGIKEFSLVSKLNLFSSAWFILIVSVFTVLFYKFQYNVMYWMYPVSLVLCWLIMDLIYLKSLKSWLFCVTDNLERSLKKQFIVKLVKMGIPLLLANTCQTFVLTIDKQIIAIFYPVERSNLFSVYSFAYTMLNLITSAVMAISLVLFPYLKEVNIRTLEIYFGKIQKGVISFLILSCSAYFIAIPFISHFLPQYYDSIEIFRVLLPGILFSSSIAIVFHNYYKALDYETQYLKQTVLILALTLITDLAVYYLVVKKYMASNPILIVYASTFVLIIWYFIAVNWLDSKHQLQHKNTDIVAVASILFFYLVSGIVNKWYIGFIIYLLYSLGIIYFLLKKEIYGYMRKRHA